MDLDGPGRDVQVGRRSPYPEEFRRDAIALYRVSGGKRTYAAVAADLGITGETLRTWVRKDTGWPSPKPPGGSTSSPAEEPARLRAENQRLLKAEREWQLEREILRRAAAYFAREVK
jgi:transposase